MGDLLGQILFIIAWIVRHTNILSVNFFRVCVYPLPACSHDHKFYMRDLQLRTKLLSPILENKKKRFEGIWLYPPPVEDTFEHMPHKYEPFAAKVEVEKNRQQIVRDVSFLTLL